MKHAYAIGILRGMERAHRKQATEMVNVGANSPEEQRDNQARAAGMTAMADELGIAASVLIANRWVDNSEPRDGEEDEGGSVGG